MIDKFKAAFREESFDLLSQLEDILLELESRPGDGELINAAFRAMHTVKGSSAMFGFDTISRFTHEVESVLDRCRSGGLSITKEFIGLTLQARDHIRKLLEFDEPPPAGLVAEGEAIQVRVRRYGAASRDSGTALPGVSAGTGPSTPDPLTGAVTQTPAEQPPKDGKKTFRVWFRPRADIFMDGTRVLNIVEELALLGESTVLPHLGDIPRLEALDPESCHCSWDLVITTTKDENALRDVFIFVEDRAEIRIETVDKSAIDEEGRSSRLGDILVDRGLVSPNQLKEALSSQKRLGEVLVERKVVTKPDLEAALVEQEHLKRVQDRTETTGGSIRVASDKLDALVDLVGELVTLQARLARTSDELGDPPLSSVAEQFERLIAQLRDNTMSIRMLPIGSTFNKFRRVVRDLTLELGKESELLTEGAETELDKTVIEKLGDPLVHIIRNSIDHGLEMPEERVAAGKPRRGSILLAARHSGAYVLIQVSDDGKGLDREGIRNKALERGIIAPGQELPEQELYQLIFAPGFSTAKVVTTVSGRGVGMDVVKREIDSLGGTVHLATAPGKGTTVTLKIPLTLAIIDGLLVRIGEEFYVVPLSSVDGCIEIRREERVALGERRILSYRDELVPFIVLRQAFDSPGEEPPIEQIVIAQAQDSLVGLVVDQVVGDYQTVIKPLGRMFRDVDGVSGATILGDGRVALILDVNRLALAAGRDGNHRAASGE